MAYLRGGLTNNQSVVPMILINNTPYYLIYNVAVGTLTFVTSQFIQGGSENSYDFQYNSLTNQLWFYEVNSEKTLFVGADVNGVAGAFLAPVAITLVPQQSVAPIAPIMTGISYVIQLTSTGKPLQWSYIMNGLKVLPTAQIFFLPLVQFQLGVCSLNNMTISQTIVTNEGYYSGTNPNYRAFTTQSDCSYGQFYNYCPAGTFCSADCKGPCETGTNCSFNGSWFCPAAIIGPPVIIPATPLVPASAAAASSSIVIWIIVAIFVILLIIAIAYYFYSRNKSTPTTTSEVPLTPSMG